MKIEKGKIRIGIGELFMLKIYGHPELVELLEIHPAGTFDVERKSDGRCFRLTGMNCRKG